MCLPGSDEGAEPECRDIAYIDSRRHVLCSTHLNIIYFIIRAHQVHTHLKHIIREGRTSKNSQSYSPKRVTNFEAS